MDFNEYWRENTFELAARVYRIRELLKPEVADTPYYRVGSEHDGGYILADDYDMNGYLISMGIDKNVDFEKELSKIGIHMDTYDYSVDRLPEPIDNARFFKEKVGSDVSLEETIVRAKKAISRENLGLGHSDLLLKMDIEGSEWDVLPGQDLSNFRQIVLEGHWLFNITDNAFYNKVVASLEALRKNHTPVWVHANNDQPLIPMGAQPVPNVIEVLYLRNSSYILTPQVDPFEGLVHRNNPAFPEIGLTFP